MKISVLTKKSGPFLDPFLGQFLPFLAIFNLGQLLWFIEWQCCVQENSCFGCFGHFWVKNTLFVVTLYGFGLFLDIFFQTVDDSLLIFCYLSYVYCLKMVNENFCSDKKIGPFLDPFSFKNLAIFAEKSGFRTFSSNPHIRFV